MQIFLNTLTIFAFLMSTVTWFLTAYNRSIRTEIRILDYKQHLGCINQFYVYVQNNSEKAFTISGASLVIDGEKYPCELVTKLIRTTNVLTLSTPNFPLNFAPLQGRMEFFEFLNCPNIELVPDKTIEIEFYTNRKVLKRFLKLPQQGRCHSWHCP